MMPCHVQLVVFEATANSDVTKFIPHVVYKMEAQLIAQKLPKRDLRQHTGAKQRRFSHPFGHHNPCSKGG